MTTTFDSSALFNCCTNHDAPDWTLFAWLETGGCTEETDETTGESWTNGGESDDVATFWTVYGRLKEGGCEAITDCKSRAEVDAVAVYLSRLSGLPLEGPAEEGAT
jgi:hypothetical protein